MEGDLEEGGERRGAMAKAKVPLLSATETAVNANAGSRAVSIVSELKNGQATAEVTLLQGTTFKKVTERVWNELMWRVCGKEEIIHCLSKAFSSLSRKRSRVQVPSLAPFLNQRLS